MTMDAQAAAVVTVMLTRDLCGTVEAPALLDPMEPMVRHGREGGGRTRAQVGLN